MMTEACGRLWVAGGIHWGIGSTSLARRDCWGHYRAERPRLHVTVFYASLNVVSEAQTLLPVFRLQFCVLQMRLGGDVHVVYVLPAQPAPVLLAWLNPIIPLRGSPRFRDRGAPWSIGSARRARRANVGHQLRLIQTWRCPILFKPPSPEIPIRSRVLERAPGGRKRRNTLVLIFLDTAILGSLRLQLRRRRRQTGGMSRRSP